MVSKIKRLARDKKGQRSQSTRRVAATLSSRGTLISHTSVRKALHSEGVKPYVQPQVPLQRRGDKTRRLRFAAEQKERDWRCCVFADEKTFVCNLRPNRCWALVAKQASLRQPKTLEGLRHAVRLAWTEVMTQEYCTTLADSMGARLLTLRKLSGAHTGY